jgi:rod shape determining protein RodA
MISHLKKIDWLMVGSAMMLVSIGLISIYSISLGRGDMLNFEKQIVFFLIGIVIMIGMSFYDWRGLQQNSYFILLLYFICVLSLVGLLFFAPEIRGIRSWYKIGSFSFDPIGVTTIVLIVLLAKYFSTRHIEMYRLPQIVLSGVYIFIPFILIARQPDLGSAMILAALWLGILVISKIKLRHFLILFFCALILIGLSWFLFLKEYQKERIMSFLVPQTEVLGINWSQTQSKIAIGSGGFFGKGFGQGSQTQKGFLSEPYNDFIFSAIAEEFGLVGISIMLFLYVIFIWRIMKIAVSDSYNFARLFASGIIIVLFSQIFIHIGMNLAILPVIGLTLPLVSYGGSNLIAIFLGLGILQSIKTH